MGPSAVQAEPAVYHLQRESAYDAEDSHGTMPVGQAIAQAVQRGGGGGGGNARTCPGVLPPLTLVPDGLLVRAQSGVLALLGRGAAVPSLALGPAPGLWRACGQQVVSGSSDSTH